MRESPWVVSDGLWGRIEPLLPRNTRRFRYPGRKPLDDRMVLSGILFVLHSGIAWEPRWVVERTFAWLHQAAACSSVMSAAPTSTKPSSALPVA